MRQLTANQFRILADTGEVTGKEFLKKLSGGKDYHSLIIKAPNDGSLLITMRIKLEDDEGEAAQGQATYSAAPGHWEEIS